MIDKSKILIVDDREENLRSLEVLLKDINAEIVPARSGNEALQKMLEVEFALVLMDVQMPGMDGFETVKIMRQDKALEFTPVIFLSAIYKEDKYLSRGIESGAVDFLVKPVQNEVLVGKVRTFLRLYENRTKLEAINATFERELLINKTLSDLAKQLIEPEKTVKEMAKSVFDASLLISESLHGFVSEIDRESLDNIGHTLSEMMGKSCRIKGEDIKITFPCGDDGVYPSIWGHVLNTGEPLMINDYMSHPMKNGLPEGHVPMKDFLSVPVKYGNEVIGQIAVTNCKTSYEEFHLEALQKIADLYAVAIKRQRDEEDKLRMEEEVRQSEKMQVIGQLAGGMAHNFNNILNGILSSAQILKTRYGKRVEGADKFTDIIISSSMRAAGITEKLLQYSKKNQVKTEPLNPDRIIRDSVAILNSTIDSKIKVLEEIEDDLWHIMGDKSSIQNVLLNLGLNGSHAIEGDGFILFRATNRTLSSQDIEESNLKIKPGDYVCLEVTDNGKGISEENLKDIYKPFFTTKQNGTGLGLSVSFRTVADHSGVMLVRSELDKGTAFTIYLPAFHGISEDIEKEEEPLSGEGAILLVDDEEINRFTGSELLESLGYSVMTAENGMEALEIYRERRQSIDLVITDMQMPEMNGLEMIKELYMINKECKVILISGFNEAGQSDEMSQYNIAGYLQKPFSVNDLSKTVSEVLG